MMFQFAVRIALFFLAWAAVLAPASGARDLFETPLSVLILALLLGSASAALWTAWARQRRNRRKRRRSPDRRSGRRGKHSPTTSNRKKRDKK